MESIPIEARFKKLILDEIEIEQRKSKLEREEREIEKMKLRLTPKSVGAAPLVYSEDEIKIDPDINKLD